MRRSSSTSSPLLALVRRAKIRFTNSIERSVCSSRVLFTWSRFVFCLIVMSSISEFSKRTEFLELGLLFSREFWSSRDSGTHGGSILGETLNSTVSALIGLISGGDKTVVATSCSARDSSDISAISFVLLLSFSIFSRISPLCEGTSGRARVVRGGVGAPQEVSGDDTPRKLALRVLRPKSNMTKMFYNLSAISSFSNQ